MLQDRKAKKMERDHYQAKLENLEREKVEKDSLEKTTPKQKQDLADRLTRNRTKAFETAEDAKQATKEVRDRLRAYSKFARGQCQAVGDALADLLLVEAVLCLQQKSITAWGALYDELPSRQLKQRVASRALLEPNATETRLVAPAALQAKIDALAASHKSGRAFVRPSGTEDVVRVYAEAPHREARPARGRRGRPRRRRLRRRLRSAPPRLSPIRTEAAAGDLKRPRRCCSDYFDVA